MGVRALVKAEQASLTSSELTSAAAGLMASEPEGLLQRIIAHFQHLFSCPSLETILPTMSQVLQITYFVQPLFGAPKPWT